MKKKRPAIAKQLAAAAVAASAALPAVLPAARAFGDESGAGGEELAEETAGANEGGSGKEEEKPARGYAKPAGGIGTGDAGDGEASPFSAYPEFGSEKFRAWLKGASDDALKAWHEAAAEAMGTAKATASDAEPEFGLPAYGSEEFDEWLRENGDDMDAVLSWISGAPLEDAKAFMEEFFNEAAPDRAPEFGADFFGWLRDAGEEAFRAWHEEHKAEGAYDSGKYPSDTGTEEFSKWFGEHCLKTEGSEEDPVTHYDYDAIYDWAVHVPEEAAYKVLMGIAEQYRTSALSTAGNLWPEDYGKRGDLYGSSVIDGKKQGTGDISDPYIIDSVEDLRTFAVAVTSGQDPISNRKINSGSYYLIRHGTYDLNGSWIPIGLKNDNGDEKSVEAFKGHLACEDGVVITNLGFKEYGPLKTEMAAKVRNQTHLGFFAKLGSGSSVTGLELQTSYNTLDAGTKVRYSGILAGEAEDATIKECTVKGDLAGSQGYVGGLVGYAHGSNVGDRKRGCVIENCRALDVTVYAAHLPLTNSNAFLSGTEKHSAVGGIAGYAYHTTILDAIVKTNDISGNHIYGYNAYVGGIVGAISDSDVINSWLESGAIGSNNGYATGGLVGGYGGGAVKVGRFGGAVIRPQSGFNYSAAFIGARMNNRSFTYGTKGDVAYLFADSAEKADQGVLGDRPSNITGAYGTDAHIGYWHPRDRGYTLVSGAVVKHSLDGDYFYEELERGIMSVTDTAQTLKLENMETIDHYTCDQGGFPIRGYLLTLVTPEVGGRKAAELTAWVLGNSYRETCTPTHQVAFAPGDVIYVQFQSMTGKDGYFQLKTPLKLNNPWYSYGEYMFDVDPNTGELAQHDRDGLYFTVFGKSANEVQQENGGAVNEQVQELRHGMAGAGDSRNFTMPKSDVTVGAEYQATSQSVEIVPRKIYFQVIQERRGDRKNPTVDYYVSAYDANPYKFDPSKNLIYDNKNKLWDRIHIATKQPNGQWTDLQGDAQKPGAEGFQDVRFWLKALINSKENPAVTGKPLRWQFSNSFVNDETSADSNHLIQDLKADGTEVPNAEGPTASFRLDLTSPESAIRKQSDKLEAEQRGGSSPYGSRIPDTVYWYHSIITATDTKTPHDASSPAYGTLDMEISFQVEDYTYASLNDQGKATVLSSNGITFNVVRTLTGDRKDPKERYTVNGDTAPLGAALEASFYPDYLQPGQDLDVDWYITDSGLRKGSGTTLLDSDYTQAGKKKHNGDELNPDTDLTEQGRAKLLQSGTGKPQAGSDGTKPKLLDDGTVSLADAQDGDLKHATVRLKGVTAGSAGDNVWIKAQNQALKEKFTDQRKKIQADQKGTEVTSTYRTLVKVTAADKNGGSATDSCIVTINYKTIDQTEIMPEKVDIVEKEKIHSYDIYYEFEGGAGSTVKAQSIEYSHDPSNENLAAKSDPDKGKGDKLSAKVSPIIDSADREKDGFVPYADGVVWSLARTDDSSPSFNPYDVLNIGQDGQITVRGYDGNSKDTHSMAYSPWIQSLISSGQLDGTTVKVRIVARSARDNSLIDYKDIEVTFTGSTMSAGGEDGREGSRLDFNVVLTKNVATSLPDTSVTESGTWSGNGPKRARASASGTTELPTFSVIKGADYIDRAERPAGIQPQDGWAEQYYIVNTSAQWIQDIISGRGAGKPNSGTQEATIQAKTKHGVAAATIPVGISFRYDGVDMTADKVAQLPSGYTATPSKIVPSTPEETYDVKKAGIIDRQIILSVVATQGNYIDDSNEREWKWSYGIVKLGNTAYTSAGVTPNGAEYELSGEIDDYCRVDKDGYLVPIRDKWDKLLDAGTTKGSVSGIVTAKKESGGNALTDSYKVTINFSTVDETEIMPASVTINDKDNLHDYDIYYTFEGNKDSAVTNRSIRIADGTNRELVNGVGEKPTAFATPEFDGPNADDRNFNGRVQWKLAKADDDRSNLNVEDVLHIDPNSGQITVRGYNDSTDPESLGYSPWIQSLIKEGKLDGTTVKVKVIAQSVRDESKFDSKEISVTFKAGTVDTDVAEDGLKFDIVLTKEAATGLPDTGINEKESWAGNGWQKVRASASGTIEEPVFSILEGDGSSGSPDLETLKMSDSAGGISLMSAIREKWFSANTDAKWIQDIISGRRNGNSGSRNATITVKPTNGEPKTKVPVTVNFRYDGVDMYAEKLTAGELKALPGDYPETPDITTNDTPADTYDIGKAGVKDHRITLDIVATQGNMSMNQAGTRKWSYGIVQLGNTTYTQEGVQEDDVRTQYVLSDEIKEYCKVDANGCLVPIKGKWDLLMDEGKTYGSVSGTITAKREVGGKTISDSYKADIYFRYDKSVLESHEEELNVVCTRNNATGKETWQGDDTVQLKAHIFDEDGLTITPDWASSDESAVTVDRDGRVNINREAWAREIINEALKYGDYPNSGTRTVFVTARNPKTGETADTCKITVNFTFETVVLPEKAKTLNVTLTATGTRSNPSYAITGDTAALKAIIRSARDDEDEVVYTASDPKLILVDGDGNISMLAKRKLSGTEFSRDASAFLKEAVKHAYTTRNPYISKTKATVTASSADRRMADKCELTINVKYVDNTTGGSSSTTGGGSSSGGSSSGGSSSGGGGGSYGGSHSIAGITPTGTTQASPSSVLPGYVISSGTWVQGADGKWQYTNGRTFTNEWAAIANPYANTAIGQSAFDWFHFGTDSNMTTGWFTDVDGYAYYLHPVADGTQGRMYTGWNWIDGDGDGTLECYYFETASNGHRGGLYRASTTPDGYTVNDRGQWTVNGIVITKSSYPPPKAMGL